MPSSPLTGQAAPDLDIGIIGASRWSLRDRKPREFTLVIFFRGVFCGQCRIYLERLARLLPEYDKRGVEIVALSMDSQDKAQRVRDEWQLGDMAIGYGLTEDTARKWGLYLSSSIQEVEPPVFSEPGFFLVRPDGMLYFAATSSAPFGRPDPEAFLASLDVIKERDYPPRGRLA